MFSCKGRQEKRRMVFTIGFIHEDREILLVYKKKGKFGVRKWNGPGGEVNLGESIEMAGVREVLEETSSSENAKDGIIVKKMEQLGFLEFEFQSIPGEIRECRILKILEYEGEEKENEQMTPRRFNDNEKEIPYDNMWQADRYWLPLLLADKKFRGWFLYDSPESGQVLDYRLEEI